MNAKMHQPLIRVALLDDHDVVLFGMQQLLATDPGIEVAASFTRIQAFLDYLREDPGVDVVIVDYNLVPGEDDGLNLIRRIDRCFSHISILVVSSLYIPATVSLALQNGARGYMGKADAISQLPSAVRAVHQGEQWLEPRMREKLTLAPVVCMPLEHDAPGEPVGVRSSRGAELTAREQEVIRRLLEGSSVTDIALSCNRSIKTISAQKQSAFRKLGVRNNSELFKYRRHIFDDGGMPA